MSAEPVSLHTQRVRTAASRLSIAGFRVLRVHLNDKRPVDQGWPELATDDVHVIDEWFPQHGTEYNIGVACGPQPNGINLVVIDVDVAHEGLVRWADLLRINGHPDTAMHATPSGGLHVFFDCPFPLNNSGSLGRGIDVRGTGGQVVVPPSVRDGSFYEPVNTHALQERYPVEVMPAWLQDLVKPPVRPERAVSVSRHPSNAQSGSQDNADWLRDHWDWVGELEKAGYTVVQQRGDRVFLAHPTATSEWSCTVDLADGRMNAYSTNMPIPWRERQTNSDGSVSWSPYDWFVVVDCDGDASEAAREINRRRGYTSGGGGRFERAANEAPSDQATDVPLYLPSGWYDQRPWMQACRQMAHAVGGSPSAHLLAYLTRWATLIPPGYTIPPINGAPSSFDLLSVIAGTSGSGKTSPMTNAETLLPIMRPDIRAGLGIGSGEGIIEMYYGSEQVEGEDGKKNRERRKIYAGVNFAVSEGLIFADLADRGGTTHVTRLCDAWSGAALSTANAKAETFRHIERGQYRLTMVMGIQAKQAHELMTDSAASQGFVGRLLFAWAEEPRVSPRPRSPERPILIIPMASTIPATREHPLLYEQVMLSYPQAVYDEIQAASDQRVGTNVPVEEHHHDLLRCKIAGIVALMEGRTSVTVEDWALATDLVNTSANVRRHLYSVRVKARSDDRHRAAEAKVEFDSAVYSITERKGIASMAENIRRSVHDAPMAVGALRKKVSKGGIKGNRHRFEPALALAIENGWVTVHGGVVHRA